MKQYILIRKDIFDQEPLAKFIIHAAHNSVWALNQVSWTDWLQWTNKNNMTKILVWINNQEELAKLVGEVDAPSCMVVDSHTRRTYCGAIGPIEDHKAEEIGLTKLKLFKEETCKCDK